jgi:hypothetical protein
MTAIEALAIILSVVSLFITVVGFFASLKFYRDGVELQGKANDALTKIEEKTAFIQGQVGGMFDKTLEAAIGKRELMAANFEEIKAQIDEAGTKLVQESRALIQAASKEVGAVGEQERKRLESIVDNQLDKIRQKVEEVKESTDDIANPDFDPSHVINVTMALGKARQNGLTIPSLKQTTGLDFAKVDEALSYLMEFGYVTSKRERVYITNSGWDFLRRLNIFIEKDVETTGSDGGS